MSSSGLFVWGGENNKVERKRRLSQMAWGKGRNEWFLMGSLADRFTEDFRVGKGTELPPIRRGSSWEREGKQKHRSARGRRGRSRGRESLFITDEVGFSPTQRLPGPVVITACAAVSLSTYCLLGRGWFLFIEPQFSQRTQEGEQEGSETQLEIKYLFKGTQLVYSEAGSGSWLRCQSVLLFPDLHI